ncbi:MAG: helix-turn-helix domain-containing protein [Rhodospirillaceae bacterium]|nr:helix-turn-helix domain-containing protein [Rhodospirillaceae bacterium]
MAATNIERTPTNTAEPLVVPIDEARRLLGGLGRSTIYRLMDTGALDAVHVGGRRMIRLASIRSLVAEGSAGQ